MKAIKLPLPSDLPKSFDGLVQLYPPRAIHSDEDYELAQEIMDLLTSVRTLTEGQAAYLDTLSILLSAYEGERFAQDLAGVSGVEALHYLLDLHGMSASDLGRLLGDRSLGSRVLRGERQLSKEHIRVLCQEFNVGADLFVG